MAERVDMDVAYREPRFCGGVFLLFTLAGGPIGGLLLFVFFLGVSVLSALQGQGVGAGVEAWLLPVMAALFMMPFYGFFLGLVPAIFTGFVYALLPYPAQRIALAPILGFLFSLVCALAMFGQSAEGLAMIYAAIGAGAALVCAWLARTLALDRRGARA